MWGSSIEGEGKRKRVHKGEFFPPYTEEDAFPSSTLERPFPSVIDLIFFIYFAFVFSAASTEEGFSFLSSLCLFVFFCFLSLGVIKGFTPL